MLKVAEVNLFSAEKGLKVLRQEGAGCFLQKKGGQFIWDKEAKRLLGPSWKGPCWLVSAVQIYSGTVGSH